MPTVYVQLWEESERGWGCRPDGASIHLTEKDADAYVAAYWATMPSDSPNEYSRPAGGTISIGAGPTPGTYMYSLSTGLMEVSLEIHLGIRRRIQVPTNPAEKGIRFFRVSEAYNFLKTGHRHG